MSKWLIMIYCSSNAWIYNLGFGPHITRFSAAVAKKQKFRVHFFIETSEHSVQTADNNIKVIFIFSNWYHI